MKTLYKIYMILVDKRDRNHGVNGFTLPGYFWQGCVVLYGTLYFFLKKRLRVSNKNAPQTGDNE